jgi:hypothetical protein
VSNDGLQLRRAISTQAEGKRLLEKHDIAPSAARLCFMKGRQEKKTILLAGRSFLTASHNVTRKPFNSRRQGSFLPSSPQQLLEIFLSDRGLASSWELPTIVLSETSTQLESLPTAISGRAGGHIVRFGP